jgi:hypothetical protein
MKIRFISFSDKVESEMKPNLTLMASLEVTAKDGKKGISRGFWGDVVTRYVVTRYVVTSLRRYVVTGPFVTFGHQVKSWVV